ncbi:aarF domain-containing kinase 1 isoform X2 [Tribolium castaneum]|uniref:aarF domain-containing kinase 1 isoform X2 n=1 Tax=Tribolium castaneum TaxID=7070 RepID=UPI0030FE8287
MTSLKLSRLLKYSLIGSAAIGTAVSLHGNQYQLNSIGIVRLSRAAVTVFQIGVIYKKDLYGKGLDKNSQEYKELKSICHKRSAEKLLELCCTNKGTYIKVGQHLAALDYLLPSEYVQTMKVLHSHAPTNPIEDVYKVIREDLKKDPFEIFQTIEPEPLGTASLAQVHKATLTDGTVVAVKVQHPYIQGNARVDLKTMEYLVKIMSWVFPEFKFQWLVDETKKNIPQELNFEQEGHNAEKVAKMFEHVEWLKIPKVIWDLTTSRVLTMEFVEGGQVNDLKYINEHGIDPFEVSDNDPHPGNIFVKRSERGDCDIILLDHGLYANLSDEFRVEYANFWLSILNRDRKAMRLHSANLGIKGDLYGLFACMVTGRTWDTILKGIDQQKQSKSEKELFQREFPNVLPQISGVLDKVNRQMLLIFKTNDLMRGIEHTLKTSARMGAFCVMSQCCVKSVYSERLCKENSKIGKFKIAFAQFWALFKIKLYYSMLSLRQLCKLQILST